MRSESGKAKAIIIAVISILVIALIAVLVVFKFKGNGNKNGEEGSTGAHTEEMSFIEETDSEYVFIDSNGNVRKIKKDSVGKISFNLNEGNTIYQNSILTKDDEQYAIVDFNGKKLYENKSIKMLLHNKDAVLYQFTEDGKYGILNAKGEVVVKPEHSEYFNTFNTSEINDYVCVVEYDSEFNGKALSIFNKDGKRVYRGPVDRSFTALTAKAGETRTGVNLVVARKNETSIGVINLKTGEEFNTITDNNDQTIDIDIKGNYAVITSYAKGNQASAIKTYYWFGEDGKVSKKLNLTDKEYISYWNGSLTEDYTIYKNYTTNEEIAIDKYGKDVYKTTDGSLSQKQYTNAISNKTISYVVEDIKKNYKTIKADGTVLFEDKAAGVVGNKYVSSGATLYKHDGSKYMDNVKGYMSVYNLDIIKTAEKVIIENIDGKIVEKEANFDLGKDAKLLNDNTVVLKNDKKLKIVNMNDLSIKELDFSSASSVYVQDGYIYVASKDSKREYYNANGDKIYTKSK